MATEPVFEKPVSIAKIRFMLEEAEQLFDATIPLPKRLAKARKWFIILETVGRRPETVPNDWRKWTVKDIEAIAEALTMYAAYLMETLEAVPIPLRDKITE